jgi:hypothetical protein
VLLFSEDPFDAEWAAIATRNSIAMDNSRTSSNPFLDDSTLKAFELHL